MAWAPEPFGRIIANVWVAIIAVYLFFKEPFTPPRFQFLIDVAVGLTIYCLFGVIGKRNLGGQLEPGEIVSGAPHYLELVVVIGCVLAIVAVGMGIRKLVDYLLRSNGGIMRP